jgi:SAM-dependent methyltransferase
MHREAQAAVKRLRPKRVRHVYEVGSRRQFKSIMGIRSVFSDVETHHGIDIAPGIDVDAVGHGETYVPPVPPDCVVCCEVLEHTANARQIVRQMVSVLAPGGTLIVTCAGPGRIPHGAAGFRIRGGLIRVFVEMGPGNAGGRQGDRTDADVYAVGVKPA